MLPIYDMMASGKLSLLSSTAVEAPVKLGGESMYERFGFVPATRTIAEEDKISESLKWIAVHCRTIAVAHMALADKVESLMEQFLDKRRFRTGLRTFPVTTAEWLGRTWKWRTVPRLPRRKVTTNST